MLYQVSLSLTDWLFIFVSVMLAGSIIAMYVASCSNEALKEQVQKLSAANASMQQEKDKKIESLNKSFLQIFKKYRELSSKYDVLETNYQLLKDERDELLSKKNGYRRIISREFMKRDSKGRFVSKTIQAVEDNANGEA